MTEVHHDKTPGLKDQVIPSWKKALFAVGLIFALLGAAEITSRLLGLGDVPEVAEHVSTWQTAPDGTKFWTLRGPGYNRDGMRDREHYIEKPPGTYRIVCLGDSVTLGHGVSASSAYPSIFESYMEQIGLPAEVFNVAVSGWSTHQQLIAYEVIVRKYQPDHVFLGFCLNDVAEMNNNLTEPPNPILGFLINRSALARFITSADSMQIHYVRELFTAPDSEPVKVGWQRVKERLLTLKQRIESDGSQLSVLIFPFRFQLGPTSPDPVAQKRLFAFCMANRIPCLDLLPVLEPMGVDAFLDESHLTPEGAAAVAEAMIRWGQVGCVMCGYDLTNREHQKCPRCQFSRQSTTQLSEPSTKSGSGNSQEKDNKGS